MYRMEFKKWLADSGTITTKKSRSSYVSRVFGAESLLRERGFADVAAFDCLPAPDEESVLSGVACAFPPSLEGAPDAPRHGPNNEGSAYPMRVRSQREKVASGVTSMLVDDCRMRRDKTTINGHIVRVIERHRIDVPDGLMNHLILEGLHEQWPIGTEVPVSYAEERFHGKITAVIAKETATELRIIHETNRNRQESVRGGCGHSNP